MAPEHPFPAGIDDCYAVTLHVLKNPLEFGFESTKVILAGDSAGKQNFDFIKLKKA